MSYDRETLVPEICRRLSKGEPMAVICRDEGMPGVTTVWEWAQADKSIAESIARARELGFDCIASECLEIADDARNDYMEALDQEGAAAGWRFNGENTQRSKLRVETRLKLLAKWDPKRYGDKQQVEHSGQVDIAATLLAARRRSGIAE